MRDRRAQLKFNSEWDNSKSYHDTAIADGPGVVLGRKGSVGTVHWIPGAYWPHDTTLWVRDFHGNDRRYVYHFLRSFPLLDYESSTANPSLNRNRLHPVE
jgi:type I restriction enzyme S subunit